jgi:hypothetical protein
MNLDEIRGLLSEWDAEVATYRRRGLVTEADFLASFARELRVRIDDCLSRPLELSDAMAESGYSYSALQKMVTSGDLPNAGSKGKPRIRRKDLPSKGARKELERDLAERINS